MSFPTDIRTYEVDPGDPHNDQMAAMAAQDLGKQLDITREVADQAEKLDAGLAPTLAAYAQSLIDQDDMMPRERLATLLALALLHLVAQERLNDDAGEWVPVSPPQPPR